MCQVTRQNDFCLWQVIECGVQGDVVCEQVLDLFEGDGVFRDSVRPSIWCARISCLWASRRPSSRMGTFQSRRALSCYSPSRWSEYLGWSR